MDGSPLGSSVPGIFQSKILQWFAITPRALPNPGIESVSPALAGEFFTSVPPGKPGKAELYFKRKDYLRGIIIEFWVILSRMKVAGT